MIRLFRAATLLTVVFSPSDVLSQVIREDVCLREYLRSQQSAWVSAEGALATCACIANRSSQGLSFNDCPRFPRSIDHRVIQKYLPEVLK
jgi:hypothetical protein